jgi:hypothetical protein
MGRYHYCRICRESMTMGCRSEDALRCQFPPYIRQKVSCAPFGYRHSRIGQQAITQTRGEECLSIAAQF